MSDVLQDFLRLSILFFWAQIILYVVRWHILWRLSVSSARSPQRQFDDCS